MGCGCSKPGGASARSHRRVSGWKVEGPDGQIYGPYLTQHEARTTLTMIGGGRIFPVEDPT